MAMKRAITLAGGGPAAGLHIGALKRLEEENINFDVWALSCIGAWVGIVYNQFEKGGQAERTYEFFRDGVFRDDISYSRFPINTVFGPDTVSVGKAMTSFMLDPKSYQNLWLPDKMMKAAQETLGFLADRTKWNEGDYNNFVLNNVLAVNPFIRYWTSMMYLSNVTGLSRIYYPESSFLKAIRFDSLARPDKPLIYHNAWNLSKQTLDQFSNRIGDGYKQIDAQSLCACSALPFVEGTVDIDGDTYCEGALIDTVNFKQLLDDHPDLDEIWISRIVDAAQVRAPKNITEALGNLCMLFAATVGEDDIKLFKYHVKEDNKWKGRIVEIKVDASINFDWTHSNLDNGRAAGYRATDMALKGYAA
jgi:predicted acylesterase/phospholipase RssA